MNGLSQAALRRAAISFSSAARLLALILGLVLGVNVATAQTVGFTSTVAKVTEGGSVTVKPTVSGGPLLTAGTVDYLITPKLGGCQVFGTETPQNATLDDFVVASGTLTYSAGQSFKNVSVQTIEDAIREKPENDKKASECFKVHLSNPGGGFGGLSAQPWIEIRIEDNEDDPVLTVSDASADEDTGFAPVNISISVPVDVDLTFKTNSGSPDVSFTDITATAGSDYNAGSTVATNYQTVLTAGSTAAVLNVQLIDDLLWEGDQTFMVQVSTDSRYDIGDGAGLVTILDNEELPVLSIDGSAGAEEGSDVEFTIVPSVKAEIDYTVLLSYSDVTATTVADYTPVTSLSIAGASPSSPLVLKVPAKPDTEAEDTESFMVSLVDAADYDVDHATTVGLILDKTGFDLAVNETSTAGKNPTAYALVSTGSDPSYEFSVENTNDSNADNVSGVQLLFRFINLNPVGGSFSGCSAAAQVSTSPNEWTCTVADSPMNRGESELVVVTPPIDALAAPGSALSVEVLVSDAGSIANDTNLKNNEARVVTRLYGADFGDFTSASEFHILSDDLRLGALRDAELAPATTDTDADGDDLTGADEDGLEIPTGDKLIQSATSGVTVVNYIAVTASDAGYLNVFGEYKDGGAAAAWYPLLTSPDFPVKKGLNWVPISVQDKVTQVGTSTGDIQALRLRICAAKLACHTDSVSPVQGGEIEDHKVANQLPAAAMSFDMPEGTIEPVTFDFEGGAYTVRDGNGTLLFETSALVAGPTGIPVTEETDFTITGTDGPNTFVVDVDALENAFDLVLEGGAGSDNLVLRDESTLWDDVTHVALNDEDGNYEMLDTGLRRLRVRYRKFAPVLDNLDATNRVFTFSDAIDDNIVIRDNGSDSDGYSFIDSNGSEEITFKNPVSGGTLTVNAGDGSDVVDFQGLDPRDGADPVNTEASFAITLNGEEFNDTFIIAPLSSSSSLSFAKIDGGAPATCVGDVLDVNTSLGAVIDEIDVPNDQITFSSSHQDLNTFMSIEHFADFVADVKLSLILPPTPATNPGDILPIQLLVENNGPATADCIKINDVLLNGALTILGGPTFTQGSFNSPMWVVGSLAPGASATLTYEVEVGYQFNGEAAITALAPQEDPNLDNNSVTLDIQPAFPFPVKAQATAALWYDHNGDPNDDDRLMVGLANGYAGLTSAVLCRVPNFGGVFSDDLPLWRECGAGLPYPLYVTDLMQVETTDPDDKDLIYLTAWGSDGLYVSTDGGESFSAVNPNVSDTHVAGWTAVYAITEDADGFLYISTNHGFVFRSLNKGVSWQQIGSLPEVDADTPWSLTSHPTEGGRIYAGTFGRGVYTSDDYGFTWEFVGGKAVNDLLIAARGGHAFDLELDPTGDFLFVGTGKGVFRMSLDGIGASTGLWKSLDMEVELSDGSKVTPEVRSLAFDMNGHLYATTWGFGAFRNPAPTLNPSIDFVKIALRGQEIAFVAISTDGSQVAFGSMAGGVELVEALAASATDTESETANTELPDGYALNQNYPNPFNPVTTISFALPETGMARLAVYDILGREVAVLVDGNLQAGQHSMQFDAQGLPTGTYIYRLETDKASFARQLVLMK